MKNTNKALLTSVVALILCCSMLVGSTFAWFTDSAASGSNVITSGNLDIEVEYTLDGKTWANLDGAKDLFSKGLWEPGHTEVVALRIKNNGSLALKYAASMNIVDETIGKTKDGENIVLSEILTVGTLVQEANLIGEIAVELAFENENAYKGTTAFKASNVLEADQELLPGSAHYVVIKVDMPESVGNEANHDGVHVPSINFGVNVMAAQYTHENDSFGNEYDKDAEYVLGVSSAEEMLNAVQGGNIGLEADTVYNNTDPNKQLIMETNDEINFNGNGNTITVTGADPSIGNHGYVGFVPPAGEDATVSNVTITGTGFVEIGHYGIGGGNYTANNLKIENLESTLANGDKGFTLGCAFMANGDAILNDCVMTGTTAKVGVLAVDLACGQAWKGYTDDDDNKVSTTVNGGKYGTVYCWSHALVTLNGAAIDTLYAAPIKGTVTIKAGTHIETLNVDYGTLASYATGANLAKLVIEDGAIVDKIVHNGNTYTVAEWNAYVNRL